MAVSSLHTTLKCSFFTDALVAFIESRQFAASLALIRVMKDRFGISRLDLSTCERAFDATFKFVDVAETLLDSGEVTFSEAESAQELLHVLWRNVERDAEETLPFGEWVRFCERVRERTASLEERDDDDYDSEENHDEDEKDDSEYNDSDDDDDDDEDDNEDFYNFTRELIDKAETKFSTMRRIPGASKMNSETQKGVLVQVQINAETGECGRIQCFFLVVTKR